MSKILELRENRAKLWDSTKAFLDSKRNDKGILSAEDTATYEKMEADVVNLGKEIDRLERQAAIELEINRAINEPIKSNPIDYIGNANKTGRATNEYKEAFWKNMRSKNNIDVYNALQIGTDSEGGYLVPDEFEKTLITSLVDSNVMRSLCKIVTTSFGDKLIPVVASRGTASWVAEEGLIPDSDDSFGQVTLGAHKLVTMIKVSEELLNDNVFNLENYIAKEFARRIGAAEEEAFIVGDGTGKPTGIVNMAQLGVTTAVNNAITFDEIIDLYYSLREGYRNNSTWLMNDSTIKVIRKLKDNSGQYLWQPSLQAGQPDTILNRPVRTSVYMPAIASTTKVAAFGDFSNYWIADRQGRAFQRLNELFAANGQVGFKASERVDGKLTLAESVKVLQMKV